MFPYIRISQLTIKDLKPRCFNKLITRLWWKEINLDKWDRETLLTRVSAINNNYSSLPQFHINSKVGWFSKLIQTKGKRGWARGRGSHHHNLQDCKFPWRTSQESGWILSVGCNRRINVTATHQMNNVLVYICCVHMYMYVHVCVCTCMLKREDNLRCHPPCVYLPYLLRLLSLGPTAHRFC